MSVVGNGYGGGTLDIRDVFAIQNQSILDFGIEKVSEAIMREIAIHNRILEDMIGQFANVSNERAFAYGSAPMSGEMEEHNEYGRPSTSKVTGNNQVHFPLKLYKGAVGWTRNFLKIASPADLKKAVDQMRLAHTRLINRELRRAIFVPTNYDFIDYLVDEYVLPVKRLANGDGLYIPVGPHGETFDGDTHNHYMAVDWAASTPAQREAALLALVKNVQEHGYGTNVKIIINEADETKFRSDLDGLFQAYPDPRMQYRDTDTPAGRANLTTLNNRPIGILLNTPAEVWVKPWGQSGYFLCYAQTSDDEQKIVRFRQRESTAARGLQLEGVAINQPLTAESYEAEFGFGVQNRLNGAVMYTGGAAYVAPTIV